MYLEYKVFEQVQFHGQMCELFILRIQNIMPRCLLYWITDNIIFYWNTS